MDQEKIGQLIKKIRTDNNLTQDEFAKMFGVTYQAVSKWENGKNIPDIAILKDISKKFNVNINDLLDGSNKKNNLKYIILGILVLFIIIIIVVLLIPKDSFEFKTITTTCSDFKITGSAAYNSDYTSIYISNVNYCGKEDSTVYKKIECNLYESYDKNNTLVSSCETKNNINLTNYLQDVSLKVDNYSASCKKFKESSLFLEIIVYDDNDNIKTYKVPLTLTDDCS